MNSNGTGRASTGNLSHWGEMYRRSRHVILTTAKQDMSWETSSLCGLLVVASTGMLVQTVTNDSAVPRQNRHPIAETCAVRNSFSSSDTHTGLFVVLRPYFTRQTPPRKPRYRRCCGFWLSSPAPRRARAHVRTSVKRWCSGWAGIQRAARPAQTPATSQHGYQSTMVW